MQSRGLRDAAVCPLCFKDVALKDVVRDYAAHRKCSFCGRRRNTPFAAPLDLVIEHIDGRVREHFDDPANGLGYETAEGGFQGETYDSEDVLEDGMGLELPQDEGTLLKAIASGLAYDHWAPRPFYGLSPEESLQFSWERFCRTVKHERRYFFVDRPTEHEAIYEETLSPGDTLARLFDYAQDAGLFVSLPAGTALYRARQTPKGKRFRDALKLGPPPEHLAKQPNRMSPSGIVMMYASEHRDTALAEIAEVPGRYTLGKFVTRRDATILDIVHPPEAASIWREVSDTLEYDPRPRLLFLQQIEKDISRPIARDETMHIEYVPTQVVTEYLRTVRTVDGNSIDGIRYRSSRGNGSSLVLFATQENMILPDHLQPEFYTLRTDRWIELASAILKKVTQDMLDSWASVRATR